MKASNFNVIKYIAAAFIVFLLSGCGQRLFETRFIASIGEDITETDRRIQFENLREFLLPYGLRCEEYDTNRAADCVEETGSNKYSKIIVRFKGDSIYLTVWTLRVVIFRSRTNQTHSNTKDLVQLYLKDYETEKVLEFIDSAQIEER